MFIGAGTKEKEGGLIKLRAYGTPSVTKTPVFNITTYRSLVV